jgi:5-methylcytosine-specific restriction enzyme subunit McrC
MLLYARTDEMIQPDAEYRMSGNRISVKTLDLNCEFQVIADQLSEIAEKYFGVVT